MNIFQISIFPFLSRVGIEVVGFSGDGDPRILNSMLHFTNFNGPNTERLSKANQTNEIPKQSTSNGSATQSTSLLPVDITEIEKEFLSLLFHCLQDTVHIGTKLRNRLLVISILLPLEFWIITISHLKWLINNISKEIHGLVYSDICPDDRMNFGSLQKMMHQRVLDALRRCGI